MTDMFWWVLQLSMQGSAIIFIILLLRIIMRNAEKKYVYFLWSIPGIKLLVPISFSGVWKPIMKQKPIHEMLYLYERKIQPVENRIISGFQVSENQIFGECLGMIWFTVFFVLLTKMIFRYIQLYFKLSISKKILPHVYLTDGICSPCVFGLLYARIYLPSGISWEQYPHIIQHEEVHWRRKDHLFKLIGYGIVLFHWFNPLVWLAYSYFVEDMEMSCDEAVMRGAGETVRKGYAFMLLNFTLHNSKTESLSSYFNEDSIKKRIKNIVKQKKCSAASSVFWKGVIVLAMIVLIPGFGLNGYMNTGIAITKKQEDRKNIDSDGEIISSVIPVYDYHIQEQKDKGRMEIDQRFISSPISVYYYNILEQEDRGMMESSGRIKSSPRMVYTYETQ